jgi:hypothetical protein
MSADIWVMAKAKKDLANVLLYALTASISDLFGISTPAIVRRTGSALLKRAEARKWIPKDLKDPVEALREFLRHYETEGYCSNITIERGDGEIYIKSYGIFDYERIEKLVLSNRHPCTILSAVAMAFLNDYFNMSVAINRLSFRLIKEQEGIEEVLNLVTVGG